MATLGHGTDLDNNNISTIGEINSIAWSMSVGSIDATQTTSPYAQSIPSTLSAGVISVSLNYDGTSGQECEDFIVEMKRKRNSLWTIDFPDGGDYEAYGYCSNVSVVSTFDSVIKMDLTIQLTGEPKFNGK